MRVYRHVVAISNVSCNFKLRNVFGLMYRDSLNILIVEGKCTGTFSMSCITEQNVLFKTLFSAPSVFIPSNYRQDNTRIK
jgi:hypothetical protein